MEISPIRLIRDDVAVWLVYAGRGRRFFELFRDTRSVFLSLPGFNANENVFQSEEALRRHLAMSDAIGRWVSGASNTPPSRNPATYNPYPYISGTSEAKSFAAELGNIDRLFKEAKVGDLILSPSLGHYDPYLIGEITQKWSKEDDREIPLLQNEIVPTRRVRWLNTALARRDFPVKVSKRLQNQHAITRVDPDFYEDIFSLVYPNYVWGDRSKLDIFGDGYTGNDPLQPYAPAFLVKYVLASVFAYEKGEFDAFQDLDPQDAIDAYYDAALIEHFGQNFNSPGKFSVIAKLASLSVLASAGLMVALADPNSNFDQTKIEVVEQVKGSVQGANKAQVINDLDGYVGSMKPVWRKRQKDLGKAANNSMPLSLDNKVEVATHKAELSGQ